MARKKNLTEDQIQEILDLYKTREFSKNEIAGRYGVSVSRIAYMTAGMPEPYKQRDKAYRELSLTEHILESFDNDTKALIETINANIYGNRNVKDACYEVVQGGCLLVYYTQVNDYLKYLKCDSGDDYVNWEVYKKIVAERMNKMYETFKKKEEN